MKYTAKSTPPTVTTVHPLTTTYVCNIILARYLSGEVGPLVEAAR